MRKELIKILITDFHEGSVPSAKPRLLEIPVNSKKIIALTGVRGSGKTYQLYNVITRLIKQKIKLRNILYFNFDIYKHDILYIYYGAADTSLCYAETAVGDILKSLKY